MSMRSAHFAIALTLFFQLFSGKGYADIVMPVQKDYISVDLGYEPYKDILNRLEQSVGKLKNRGEAHITVITPSEFKKLLKYYSKSELHMKAQILLRDRPRFKHICLGVGQKSTIEKTYYVVIKDNELYEFRRKLAQDKKVADADFNPELFYPHITIGFTKRDLHFEDGIKKDSASCLKDFKL